MPKKKSAPKPRLRNTHLLIATATLVVVCACMLILHNRQPGQAVKVTAPTGTTSRSDQLNASEVSEESAADTKADTDLSTALQSDSALVQQVSGTADEK